MGHFTSTAEQKVRRVKVVEANEQSGSGRSRRRRGSAGTARSMSSQLLGLSLFIMLLAFFIVLNAISNFEESKIKPIMANLSYTFAANMEQEVDDRPNVRQSENTSTQEGDTLDRMRALFTSQIPAHEAAVNKTRGEMHVRLPYQDFKDAVMAVGQQDVLPTKQPNGLLKGFFLPTLVALMRNDDLGRPYRLDILLNIKDNPAEVFNDDPQQMNKITRDMSAIAQKIESAGLPVRLISTGVQEGEEDTVDLLFRPHIPYVPTDDLEVGEE